MKGGRRGRRLRTGRQPGEQAEGRPRARRVTPGSPILTPPSSWPPEPPRERSSRSSRRRRDLPMPAAAVTSTTRATGSSTHSWSSARMAAILALAANEGGPRGVLRRGNGASSIPELPVAAELETVRTLPNVDAGVEEARRHDVEQDVRPRRCWSSLGPANQEASGAVGRLAFGPHAHLGLAGRQRHGPSGPDVIERKSAAGSLCRPVGGDAVHRKDEHERARCAATELAAAPLEERPERPGRVEPVGARVQYLGGCGGVGGRRQGARLRDGEHGDDSSLTSRERQARRRLSRRFRRAAPARQGSRYLGGVAPRGRAAGILAIICLTSASSSGGTVGTRSTRTAPLRGGSCGAR